MKPTKQKSKKKYITRKKTIKKRPSREKRHSHSLYPAIRTFKKGFPLYASKTYSGDVILEYTKKQEEIFKDKCLMDNISWFGDYKEAKYYKTNQNHLYKWSVKKETRLIIMNTENELFFKHIFQNSHPHVEIKPTINIVQTKVEELKKKLREENMDIKYLTMTDREKAYYEFQFAYGYISVEEQYQFMLLIRYLIKNDYIHIETREGHSIVTKLTSKINYYYYLNTTNHTKHNRLSFYLFDKVALRNLCKLLPETYKIDGVIQYNLKSFWFPNLIFYQMDIKEYVLFRPHNNLKYDRMIE
jgi:hypothetical protein